MGVLRITTSQHVLIVFLRNPERNSKTPSYRWRHRVIPILYRTQSYRKWRWRVCGTWYTGWNIRWDSLCFGTNCPFPLPSELYQATPIYKSLAYMCIAHWAALFLIKDSRKRYQKRKFNFREPVLHHLVIILYNEIIYEFFYINMKK